MREQEVLKEYPIAFLYGLLHFFHHIFLIKQVRRKEATWSHIYMRVSSEIKFSEFSVVIESDSIMLKVVVGEEAGEYMLSEEFSEF